MTDYKQKFQEIREWLSGRRMNFACIRHPEEYNKHADALFTMNVGDLHIHYYIYRERSFDVDRNLPPSITLEITNESNGNPIVIHRIERIDMDVIDIETEAIIAFMDLNRKLKRSDI